MGRAGCIVAVTGLLAGCLSSPPDGDDFELVDEMTVRGDCTVFTSQTALADGVAYRLAVDGDFSLGADSKADAEYFWLTATPESVLDDASGIEIGLAIDDIVIDEARTPDWGAYRSDHRYEVEFIGQGAPINAQFHDSACGDNAGTLQLEILGPSG